MRDVLILCYHAVSERWPAPLSVTPEQLSTHVQILVRRKYRGVTFSEAAASPSVPKAVAITFDDGYRSVYELARPILDEAGLIATVFAPTKFVGHAEPMSWPGIEDWLDTEHRNELIPMSWSELEQLREAGWEVGSHTHSHPSLPSLDQATLESELTGSREEIERRLGRCRSLAYPYGRRDPRVVEAAQRAGYTAAGTLAPWPTASAAPLEASRIGVYHVDDERRFRIKVWRLMRRARATRGVALLEAAWRL